ncbi:ribosomal RNA assembly protein krr1 [Neocucurbitaria cava]|uniref:Ribosomal RNA assembly protein krr1 n=1 Tax=Neocucurbitaria cava TaxID=798079 RepID=A0A9W8Y7M4_9PLEO|nr:ribosomal RNA assembly protein krr1 [Neocucurbitaria cava]
MDEDPSALAAQHINTDPGTWQATPIPGKGIGMLASKPLNFKDRVTAYTPAFLAYLETELSTLDREAWWKLAIEQLPEKTKADFMNLTYVFGDMRIRIQDIVKANTFQVDVEGVNHLAIFPETSRLNHACNPK